MNYVITYSIYGNTFRIIADDEGFCDLEERQDKGELVIDEVIEAPGERI